MPPEARTSQGLESVHLLQGGTGVIEEGHCTTLEERRIKGNWKVDWTRS